MIEYNNNNVTITSDIFDEMIKRFDKLEDKISKLSKDHIDFPGSNRSYG